MNKLFYFKKISSKINEEFALNEILSCRKNVWWGASDEYKNGTPVFNKGNAHTKFFMSRIENFPELTKELVKLYPQMVIKNSYVTKCKPWYQMIPHIDKGRETAIIMPLGKNKGQLYFYQDSEVIQTVNYTSPILANVSKMHSALNNSDTDRYSITIEVSGPYYLNLVRYW